MAYEREFYTARTEKEEFKDINEELVIPDYCPEIKKILACRESAGLPECIYEGDSVSVQGEAVFNVIYVGTDGGLYCTPLRCGYSFSFAGASQSSNASSAVSAAIDLIGVKALSPRRLSVKGRIKMLFAMQSADGDKECITEGNMPPSCEALYKNVEYTKLVSCDSESFETVDEVVNDIATESPRIIYCESSALVSDTDSSNGRVSIRGEISAEILICDDSLDEVPRLIRRKTPFSYTLSEACADEGADLCAFVTPHISEARIEDRGIIITTVCTVKVYAVSLGIERVCSDIYSPVSKLSVTEGSIDTYVPVVCGNKNMSVNLSLSAADVGISPERKIAFSFACAYPEKISVCEETGRESIVGKVVFKIITVDDSSEEKDYDCREVSAPFKYDISRETASDVSGAPIFLLAEACTSRTLSRFDGERAGLDTEISLAFFALKRQKSTVIASVTQGEKIEKNNEYIRIIYPAKGDSLWSIAKKMNIPTGTLAAKNGIKTETEKSSPSSISEVKYLIL